MLKCLLKSVRNKQPLFKTKMHFTTFWVKQNSGKCNPYKIWYKFWSFNPLDETLHVKCIEWYARRMERSYCCIESHFMSYNLSKLAIKLLYVLRNSKVIARQCVEHGIIYKYISPIRQFGSRFTAADSHICNGWLCCSSYVPYE